MLSLPDADHFELVGHTFKIPTFENAETLAETMAAAGILKIDDVVAAVLAGSPKAMSDRAQQRHFARATGLTRKALDQIHRAQQAVTLLQAGKRPVDAANETGYSDQPHLAKSLKRIMNSAPSNVDDIHKL
jgi:methylphosphotriester-DNA--protein-cysteine methyltransferase